MSDSNLVLELDEFLKAKTEQQNGTQKSTSIGEEVSNKEDDSLILKMTKLGKGVRSSYYNRLICKGFLCQMQN